MRQWFPTPPQPRVAPQINVSFCSTFAPRKRERSSGASRGFQFARRKQGDTERADRSGIWRHNDFASGLPGHGRRERVGGKRHALAKNHLADRAVAFHTVQVVLDDGIVEAGNNGGLLPPPPTASSITSAMKTEQCCPSETPPGAATRLRQAGPHRRCPRICRLAPR